MRFAQPMGRLCARVLAGSHSPGTRRTSARSAVKVLLLAAVLVHGLPAGPFPAFGDCILYENYLHWAGRHDSGNGAIAATSNYAYIGEDGSSFTVLDISDPAAPALVASLGMPGHVRGIALEGDYAFVADGAAGLTAVRIIYPDDPLVEASLDTPGAAEDVVIQDHYAYVADGVSGLQIIDIADPRRMEIAGGLDTPGEAEAVAVSGSHVYVADQDSLLVIDASDPTLPLIVASLPLRAKTVDVDGTLAYIGTYGLGDSFHVVDISDPSIPVVLASSPILTVRSNTVVRGDRAFVAGEGYDESSYLFVINVENPDSPHIDIAIDLVGDAVALAITRGHALVTSVGEGNGGPSIPGGLTVFDIESLELAPVVGHAVTLGTSCAVAIQGPYAYVANWEAGLQVINVVDPGSPTVIGTVPMPDRPRDVSVSGEFAYVAASDSGLAVVHLLDPRAPEIVATLATPDPLYVVAAAGPWVYAVSYDPAFGAHDCWFHVIDVTLPTEPSIMASVELQIQDVRPTDVQVTEDHACVTFSLSWIHGDYDGGLAIIDVSDPTSPWMIGDVTWMGPSYGLAIAGQYAFLGGRFATTYMAHLSVLDMTDPSSPQFVSCVITPGWAAGAVSVAGDYAYVASGGLCVVDIGEIATPKVLGGVPGLSARDIQAAENLVFVAGGGLLIYPAHCDDPVPVLLSGFRAAPQGRAVLVSWFTSFEDMHDGFNVYRSGVLESGYARLNDRLIRGRSPYSYLDRSVRSATTYYYKLGAIDLGGHETLYGPATATTPAWTTRTELHLASPSPFGTETVLQFTLAAPLKARLTVFDVAGRLVRVLVNEELPIGDYDANWDGRDDAGLRVAGGTYFVKLTAGDVTQTRKVVYLGGK